MSFIEIIVFVFNTLVIVHFNVHNMKMMCQIPNKKKKFQVNVTLCNVKCGNHGDDSGIECSDDIHNTYCMACVDNKLVGCSWICPLFAYSCHASILIIINFELFLSLGAMIIFDSYINCGHHHELSH